MVATTELLNGASPSVDFALLLLERELSLPHVWSPSGNCSGWRDVVPTHGRYPEDLQGSHRPCPGQPRCTL